MLTVLSIITFILGFIFLYIWFDRKCVGSWILVFALAFIFFPIAFWTSIELVTTIILFVCLIAIVEVFRVAVISVWKDR